MRKGQNKMEDLLNRFVTTLKQNRRLMDILDYLPQLSLKNYYLAAGCVFQNVWNELDGRPLNQGLHDIDLVFFDPDKLDRSFDEALEKELSDKFGLEFDVHNEAAMHLYNGRSKPYLSCEDAILNWPATVHAIGIKGNSTELLVYAPYGLEDIYQKIVRPTYSPEISAATYNLKAQKWQSRFDGLTVLPFDQNQVKK